MAGEVEFSRDETALCLAAKVGEVEFLRDQAALRLAALEVALAPYADRPEVQRFQEEARGRLASPSNILQGIAATNILKCIPATSGEYPKWVERCNNGLNENSANIHMNCTLIRLGHNPPGWDPHEWNKLAYLAEMEGCDLKDSSQVYQLISRLEAKADAEDAAERRRSAGKIAPAPQVLNSESRQSPQKPQRDEKNDAEQPKSAAEFRPYRIEGPHLLVESHEDRPVKLTPYQRKTLAIVIAAGEKGVVLSTAPGAPVNYSYFIGQIRGKLAMAKLPDYIIAPGDDGKGAGGVYAIRPA